MPFMEVWENFGQDWESLRSDAQRALATFLERLQRNPYDPDIQKKAVLGDNERFAYEFYPGYVLYWRIDCESLSVSMIDQVSITLLGLRTKKKRF
jgi:hypothetical protein